MLYSAPDKVDELVKQESSLIKAYLNFEKYAVASCETPSSNCATVSMVWPQRQLGQTAVVYQLYLLTKWLEHTLLENLADREHEIDHLQAQLDKLRCMNFGSRSRKVSRCIAQMEADLKALQKESDTLTGQVDDPVVQRLLRQTRTRKPFPKSLPRDEKRMLPAESALDIVRY